VLRILFVHVRLLLTKCLAKISSPEIGTQLFAVILANLSRVHGSLGVVSCYLVF
jgi:hypothetical protein